MISRTLFRILQVIAAMILVAAVAQACNIPVFRYALERWQPDSCEVIVFHRGKLTADDDVQVQALEKHRSPATESPI